MQLELILEDSEVKAAIVDAIRSAMPQFSSKLYTIKVQLPSNGCNDHVVIISKES